MRHTAIKAVIPAAGLGTRFLPATKAMPKEMLPVVDKPAIQYVVEEAVQAGIEDILVIIGRNKNAISNHFDSVPELEYKLKDKGDFDRLHRVLESSDLADIHFVRQGEPKGLGHAVLRAQAHVGDSSFAVLLGDDLIDERDELLTQMIAEHERTGAAVIALMEVDPAHIHMYGVASVEETDHDGVVKVTGLVERYDESLLLLQAAYGCDNVYYYRSNVTSKRLRYKDLTADQKRALDAVTGPDYEIFEWAKARPETQIAAQGEPCQRRLAEFKRVNPEIGERRRRWKRLRRRVRRFLHLPKSKRHQ